MDSCCSEFSAPSSGLSCSASSTSDSLGFPPVSEHSYGVRPGRRVHDVVRTAPQYIQDT